ncbi:MAG: FAD-dependent oxidoreductase [Acidobacteria bacterium]|nr:FAD-dependent oxidoreductase [Acidobacteriota bacterium]
MRIFETPLYPYERSPDHDAPTPVRHPVAVVGAGPAGLAAAIDLARRDIPVVLLDENDRVSHGSRAICFAKRALEIFDRLGCGDEIVDHGVTWSRGKVFFRDRRIYEFDLLAEEGHRRPAFINLQQYRLEELLVRRLRDLQSEGRPVELRGGSRVTKVEPVADSVLLTVDTPEGPYRLEAEWVVACDGAGSTVRRELGLEFAGRVFEDHFLIADVVMKAGFPTERWFWFDPPFNPGQSALLHKQPEGLWRIDLQLGPGVDREEEQRPENVVPRLRQMLGDDIEFEIEWISVYTFQCARIDRFRHGRVLFAGDAAHQVSPFGARGANSGLQDVDNLVWKLERVLRGGSPDSLLDSYDAERVPAADENILNSTRSTDFISPKSETSRLFRDTVLNLAETQPMARPLVNSGRLSLPHVYLDSPLQSPDTDGLPARTRPGSPAVDAPIGDGWLLARLGDHFQLLALGNCAAETGCAGVPAGIRREAPASGSSAALGIDVPDEEPDLEVVRLPAGRHPLLDERYLGDAPGALYLLRPDQHVAARFTDYDPERIASAFRRASAQETDDP